MNQPQIFEKRRRELLSVLNNKEHFDTAIVIGRVNLYYYLGTIQDGLFVIRSNGDSFFFVRKSVARAKMESDFNSIIQIRSYSDMNQHLPQNLGHVYLETEVVPMAMLSRIQKYFDMPAIHGLDGIISMMRSKKDPEEIALIESSAQRHNQVMLEVVPALLREGMSETDFAAELYAEMIKHGHHGVSRFSMFQMEMIIGQFGFGDTSIYPTNFDGPGGMKGMSPAVPIVGDRNRKLKKGDLVFVDVGFGYEGYHSDKTQVYSFGTPPDEHVASIHNACIGVMKKAEALIVPGADPGRIYDLAMADLPLELSEHFMGFGESIRFLGHGVGLFIDELPVITSKYHVPLEEGMIIALEPKCGIEGVGTVGVEETFLVTSDGAKCLTGGPKEIITLPLK